MLSEEYLATAARRVELHEVTTGLSLDLEVSGEQLSKAISEFNQDVAETNRRAAELERTVAEAVEATKRGGTPDELIRATNERRSQAVSHAQDLVRLWRTHVELSTRVGAAYKVEAEEARQNAEDVKATVTEEAIAIGFRRGATDPDKHRFDHFLRNENVRVRDALGQDSGARERLRNWPKRHGKSEEGLHRVQRYLDQTIQQISQG